MNEDIRDDERNPGSQTGPYEDEPASGGDISDEDIAERALRALRGESDPLRGRRVAERDMSEAEVSGYEPDDRSVITPRERAEENASGERCPNCGQVQCVCPKSSHRHFQADDALTRLHAVREEGAWFHGDEAEIWNRVASLESALDPVRRLIDAGYGSDDHVTAEAETLEEIRTLRETAVVYSESVQEEFLENLPGGTVAMDYGNLLRGGVMDPGYDDGSPLYAAAFAVAREAATYNWEAFATRGAREWVRDKARTSPAMLGHELVTRSAAVDYARDKTMVLMDPVRRAAIVDAFVTEAERARRDEALGSERRTAARQAAVDAVEQAASSTVQAILDAEGVDWF